jgi:pimeloyl-ACP methyl ester carboxylesterase
MVTNARVGPVTVSTARNRDVEIAYEAFGQAGGMPLLLIGGLDFQMVWWPEGFCQALADRGFAVARFDNRDAGLSTHFTSAAKENPWKVLLHGSRARPAYTAADMTDDGVAVMQALGWESAHVIGASMGAGLALGTAIRHPARVRTVTTIAGIPPSVAAVLRYVKFGAFLKLSLMRQPDTDEGAIEGLVAVMRAMASPNHPFDGQWARSTAEISHQRSPRDPTTTQRQLAAGRASLAMFRRLDQITAPALILHGADDPLIRPSAAAALARAIPGARAVVYPAMGHELPEHLWRTAADAVAQHASSALSGTARPA